jgi:hypothetical protein
MMAVQPELAELALDAVQLVAVVHGHAGGQVVAPRMSGSSVTMTSLPRLREQAVHDLQHRVAFGPLAHALAAGHGHRVVVEHLVGDVGAGRDALADGQQPLWK